MQVWWGSWEGSALIAPRREKEPQVEVPFQPPCGSRGLDGFPTCPSPHPTLNTHLAGPAVLSALKGLLDPPSFFYQLFDLRGWSPGGTWQPPEFSTLRGRPKTNKSMNKSRISFTASCDLRCPQIPESRPCRHRKVRRRVYFCLLCGGDGSGQGKEGRHPGSAGGGARGGLCGS